MGSIWYNCFMPYTNTEHDAYMKNIHYMRIKDPKEIDHLAHEQNLTVSDAAYLVRNENTSKETIAFLYKKYYSHLTEQDVKVFHRFDDADKYEGPNIYFFFNHQLPSEIVELWSNSRDESFIYKIVEQKNLSKETLNNLIFRDDAADNAKYYIKIPNLTEAQIDRLADLDLNTYTYIKFFKQKNLSTETAWKVFNKGIQMEEFPLTLALKKNLPDGMLEALAEHKDPWVRRKVGLNPKTPVPVLEKLADDPELTVKIGVAKNPNVSAETLGYLHDIDSKQIQNSLDKNPTWQRHIGKY